MTDVLPRPSGSPILRRLLRRTDEDRADNGRGQLLRHASPLTLGAAALSALWVGGCLLWTQREIGLSNMLALLPHEIGGSLAGLVAPVALIWLVANHFSRPAPRGPAIDFGSCPTLDRPTWTPRSPIG